MSGKIDLKPVKKILLGVMTSAVITIILMVILTGAVVLKGLDDGAIRALNQVIKVISVLFGVLLGVGRGGERGLLTGAAIGIVYILVGYGLYSIIDGAQANAKVMAIEEAAGGLIGASAGVVLANMRAGKRARAYR